MNTNVYTDEDKSNINEINKYDNKIDFNDIELPLILDILQYITDYIPIDLDLMPNTNTSYRNIWSSSADMNVARAYLAGCGTQDSALSFGGSNGRNLTTTEKFDGNTWSSTGYMNSGRNGLAGAGGQSNALAFGGYHCEILASAERFAGSDKFSYNK